MSNDIQISEREREILRLVATGLTNQQIAHQLKISPNTVKVHLRNIFTKIDVESRTEATVYAIRTGIVAVELASTTIPAVEEEQELSSEIAATSPVSGEAIDGLIREQPLSATEPATPLPLESTSASTTAHITPHDAKRGKLWQQNWFWMLLALGSIVSIMVVGLVIVVQRSVPGSSSTTVSIATPSPSVQRWGNRNALPNPRNHFAMVAFDLEREIYIIGGELDGQVSAAVDRYDPVNDRWVTISEKPTAVSHSGAATLQGKIYLPGGEDAQGKVLSLLEIYDPRERRWERGASMPNPRSQYALIPWEGKLYLIGGWDGQRTRSEVLIYDPAQDRWSEGPPLQVARRHASATIMGGRLYVFGGENESGALRDSIRLDPGSLNERRWHPIAPLPKAISRLVAITTINTVLVFNATSNEFWQYDQTVDAWQSFPLPPEAMVAPCAVFLDTSIYFVAEATAPLPGAVSEYQAIYSVLVPLR